jgi:putative ATPase
MALLQAVAAAHAVEHVGLPEARLNLAQATIYLARAPKSNSVYTAISAALEDAASADPVPTHLRDASYRGAAKLGHGEGYRYPHDFPEHHVEQEYRPPRFEGARYYEPSGQGDEGLDWSPGAGPSREEPPSG